jgi:hypothetical protein
VQPRAETCQGLDSAQVVAETPRPLPPFSVVRDVQSGTPPWTLIINRMTGSSDLSSDGQAPRSSRDRPTIS